MKTSMPVLRDHPARIALASQPQTAEEKRWTRFASELDQYAWFCAAAFIDMPDKAELVVPVIRQIAAIARRIARGGDE